MAGRQVKTIILQGLPQPIRVAHGLFLRGYRHDARGERQLADSVYQDTIEYLEFLRSDEVPKISEFELACCAFNHGRNLYRLARFGPARAALGEAATRFEALLITNTSANFVEKFASCLRWLALAQFHTGDSSRAYETYRRSLLLWKNLIWLAPSPQHKRLLQRCLSVTLFGCAKVLESLDNGRLAKAYFAAASTLLHMSSRRSTAPRVDLRR